MSTDTAPRVQRRVDLHFRLATPEGQTPTTRTKSWYFEVPASRDNDAGWTELLHRIFFDANVLLRSQQPGDSSWLALDSFQISAVDADNTLAWDGATNLETVDQFLPWHIADSAIVWEYSACYYVEDDGRYDGLDANSYSELIANRALESGQNDSRAVTAFLDRLYPGKGSEIFESRATRMGNIAMVRALPPTVFRKPVDQQPWVSGPPH